MKYAIRKFGNSKVFLNFDGAAAGQRGSILVGVMAFGIIIALGSVSILNLVAFTNSQEINSLNDVKAFYAAESGLRLGAKWMENGGNCEEVGDMSVGHVMENVIPGLYINGFGVQVDIVRRADGVFIFSDALSEDILGYTKTVSQLADPGETTGGDSIAINYAILAENDFDFGGCGNIAGTGGGTAPIHANGELDIRGNANGNMALTSSTRISMGKKTVEGSGMAPDFNLHKNANFTEGITVAAVPVVSCPEIELKPWYLEALKNGEVHSGFTSSSSYTPDGGILWVDGDVHLSGGPGTTLRGQIIATGSVHISGQVNVLAPDTGFAIASQAGDITITTSGTIQGFVYAKDGDYRQTANGNLEGQLIVCGDIKKGGNSDIIVYQQHILKPPGGAESGCPNLVAGSWAEQNE